MKKRKTLPPEPVRVGYKQRCVSIPDEFDAVILRVGNGCRSLGVRELVRAYVASRKPIAGVSRDD